MAYSRTSRLLALLMLTAATATQATAAPVTLSPGASRNCTGTMNLRTVDAQGRPIPTGMPETAAITETLSIRLTDGLYELRHNATDPEGQTLMIARIRPDGRVIDATVSGAGAAGVTGDQLRQLAMLGARALPERLAAGREFRPGDSLYSEAETQAMLGGLTSALGLSADMQMEATSSMPLTGTAGEGAGKTLNFAGPATVRARGTIGGQMMEIEISGQGTTSIDATTGLLRASSMEGRMDFKADGVSQMVMHMRQTLTCIITAGTA